MAVLQTAAFPLRHVAMTALGPTRNRQGPRRDPVRRYGQRRVDRTQRGKYVRRNAYITAAGVYSQRYLRWAIEVVGVERILFATNYPYRPSPDDDVEHFLATAGLDRADQERIAAGNWDALVAAIRR